MKILLILVTLNNPHAFNFQVVDQFATEKECRQVISKIPGELRIYHGCLNTENTIKNTAFYQNIKNDLAKKGK